MRKHIVIVSHYSQQPPFNNMYRHHNWGKELVKRGYDVTIVAASTVHNTDIDVIDELGTNTSEKDGVNYYYIKCNKYEGNGVGRIRNMLSFSMGIKKAKIKKPDIVICFGAYLFPSVKSAFKGIPLIVDIADLWPLSIVEYAGINPKNPMIQTLYYLEKEAYIGSSAIIFSMEGGEDYLRERDYGNKINYNKVFHINMGCDITQKDYELQNIQFDLDWEKDKFDLVYCGAVRQANQVQQICDAAKEIKKRNLQDIQFHIYGNGTDQERLEEYCKQENIDNVKFYGRIEKEKIPYILAHADANILTYKQVDLMKYGGSQSKLFDYLAAGKPILCNAKFGYNLIERYNCGVVTEDQSEMSFADCIEKLRSLSQEELETMGRNSRKTAELYDQPYLVDRLCEVFDYVEKQNIKFNQADSL